jgi:multidrug transporter EmrE-like cation transporter
LAIFFHFKAQQPVISGWKLYLFVVLVLLSETAAMSFLKEYALSGNIISLICGFFGYAMVSMFLIRSYRYEGMGIVNVLWSAFSVILVIATGLFFFGEHISTPEACGTAFVILGVVILRWPTVQKSAVQGGQCLHLAASDLPV